MKKYGKRMQFDPMTGEPIDPEAKFDPMTGKPCIATMENREKQERRLQSLEG